MIYLKRIDFTRNLSPVLPVFVMTLLVGCGLSAGGGTASLTYPNDAVPAGTLLAQGSLSGANGQTASGTASVYVNGTSYTLRLANLSVTSQVGLQAQVFTSTSGQAVCTIAISYYTGNKNYSCSASGGTFSSVNIYSTSTLQVIATALLQSTYSTTNTNSNNTSNSSNTDNTSQ